MASSFLGKWKVDPTQTTGLDKYGPALGLSPEQIEVYKVMVYTIELSIEGDTYTMTLSYETNNIPSQTVSYELGKPFDYHALDGTSPKLTITFDGGKFVEDYKLGEKEWQVVREVNGTVMTSTTTSGGASLVQKLNKQ